MWDVKKPTHYSKRVGHEFPGIVTVLCECMSGYREGDCLAWDLVSRSHITLHFSAKVVKKNLFEFIPFQLERFFQKRRNNLDINHKGNNVETASET